MQQQRRKRRLNWDGIISFTFFVTCFLYLMSSIFLRSYNSYLNVQLQEYEIEIANLSKSNETAQMEVNQLSTYDRILDIAADAGMKAYSDNVITVSTHD